MSEQSNACKKSFRNNWFLDRHLNSAHKSKTSKVGRKHNTNKVDTTENLLSWNVEDGNMICLQWLESLQHLFFLTNATHTMTIHHRNLFKNFRSSKKNSLG